MRAAASESLEISFFSFSFCVFSNACRFWKFSVKTLKLPLCTSMSVLFIESIWSTHPSRNARSCETKINPFLAFKYSATFFLPSSSRWFVGSSISRKLPSFRNRAASSSLVLSPFDRVLNGRYRTSASTLRRESSQIISQSSASGQISETIS